MDKFNSFPPPPVGGVQSYSTNGKFNQPIVVATQDQNGNISPNTSTLGVSFSKLISNDTRVGAINTDGINLATTETKKKRKTTKKRSGNTTEIVVSEPEKPNSKDIVENTIYAESYADTTTMAYDIITQADSLLKDCKQELDSLRVSRNTKGRSKYIVDTVEAMSSLMQTKLSAIKEINSTIKSANDAEYRRFKDMRAIDNADDNKMIMDAYGAFISAPIGAPPYALPSTSSITGGLNGVIVDTHGAPTSDDGMNAYMSRLTPEENLMLIDNNRDIEEVIVYDQATGAKQFKWMNIKTNQILDQLPPSSSLTLDDYVIDPRTNTARNINLNDIKKIVPINSQDMEKF